MPNSKSVNDPSIKTRHYPPSNLPCSRHTRRKRILGVTKKRGIFLFVGRYCILILTLFSNSLIFVDDMRSTPHIVLLNTSAPCLVGNVISQRRHHNRIRLPDAKGSSTPDCDGPFFIPPIHLDCELRIVFGFRGPCQRPSPKPGGISYFS